MKACLSPRKSLGKFFFFYERKNDNDIDNKLLVFVFCKKHL